jgi:hypothetical protein
MSTTVKNMLPVNTIDQHSNPRAEGTDVYNLMVLVRQWKDGGTSARAANLPMREVQAETVREALATLVAGARELIADCLAHDNHVPWIDPPSEPEECESRFMVPLHL